MHVGTPSDVNLFWWLCPGTEHLSTYLKVYKIGDIVDIKVCVFMIIVLTSHLHLHIVVFLDCTVLQDTCLLTGLS